MIEDSNKVWEEIFVVNDPTFELSYIGDNIPIFGQFLTFLVKFDHFLDRKTAFWSFKNKKSIFEFTREDFNDYESFNEQLDNNVNKWFQLDNNYGQYKLEDIVTIEYNSMILYPSFYWHSPYLKSDWFTNADRITLTGFFAIDPNNMS